jgi:EAL domain-containing protein (putative c-di-GMP-specific phosphodiesterase class I)
MVFQAIFDAIGGQVVGFEALLRGPSGPLEMPMQLLAAARQRGRAGELDWLARASAFRAMLEADLPPALSLFVNIDPESLLEPCPEDLLEIIWAAQTRLRVFVEMTETVLLREPVRVLQSTRRAREAGWGVALDNVGYGATGLALLPVIRPDVIKLDHQLLAEDTGHASAAIAASSRHHLQTGAALLVERFEDDHTVPLAQSLGVGFRQGRTLGMEGALPHRVQAPLRPVPLLARPIAQGVPPWDVLLEFGEKAAQTNDASGVSGIVRHLLAATLTGLEAPVIGVMLPNSRMQDARTASVYRTLLDRSPLQIVIGPNAAFDSNWRTWSAELPASHPWADTLAIVAITSTSAISVAARPVKEVAGDERHELLISHEIGAALAVFEELVELCDSLAGTDLS